MNEEPNADRQQVSRDLLSSRFTIRLQKIMPIHLDRVFSSQNREKKKDFCDFAHADGAAAKN